MRPTERLYFTDSGLLMFSATVLDVKASDRGDQVILDRTAFYPTGGGQPNDTGVLGNTTVLDVFEDEAGTIFHLVKDAGSIHQGQGIEGSIDQKRRLDHLQQHSGQHILSQAFIQACGAETHSFHLGAQVSTIDIDLQSPTDDHMRMAEDIANQIIFDNRPMRVHIVNEEESAKLPLRKESAVKGDIRVIEVEDFDWSPCGGTHAKSAGQVGLIVIKSYERAKKLTRVEFVCGMRALEDYRQANSTAVAVARLFSAERDTTPDLVSKTLQENKTLKRRQRELINLAMTAEAAEILKETQDSGGFKLVQAVFDQRDAEELRVLASKITAAEPSVVLLGSRDTTARLVFARSSSLDQNMGALLAEACQTLGGRGGGKPDMAQGGGPALDKLNEVIKTAAEKILSK